jgi:hypothetical protein
VQAAAREHTAQAIATLVEALKDERYRVSAANALLDRAWGKPPQTQNVTVDGDSAALLRIQFVDATTLTFERPAPATIDHDDDEPLPLSFGDPR